MDDINLQDLLMKEKPIFDIKPEDETTEKEEKPNRDFKVYSKEFFSNAKVDSVTAKPFNFDEIADKCEKLTDDGGVMKLLTKRGIGALVPSGSSVLIKFSAYVEYADEPFDFCKTPVTIDLGSSMLRGMNIALASMRKAEKASFYMQPHYAYGKIGCIKPFVPPNSICLFVIEMVDYEEKGGAGEFFDIPPAERRNIPFDVMLGIARIKKKEAQRHFKNKEYERAKAIYERFIKDLSKYDLDDEKEKFEQKDMLLKILCNTALCHLCTNDHDNCLSIASEALHIDPNCAKALYFKAKAMHLLGDVEGGLCVMMQAHKIMPKNKDINLQLHAMNKAVGEQKKDEKKVCERMMLNDKASDALEPETEAFVNYLSDDLKEEMFSQFNSLKESEDMTQKISLSKDAFTDDEIASISHMATSVGLKVYPSDNTLVIAKL